MNKKIKTAALAGLSALALASCSSTNKVTKDSDNATRPDNAYMDIDSKFLTFSNDQRATINKGNTFAVNLFKTQIDKQSKVLSQKVSQRTSYLRRNEHCDSVRSTKPIMVSTD